MALADAAMDISYSQGLLHRMLDKLGRLRKYLAKLKSGTPFLHHLYYGFDLHANWLLLLRLALSLSHNITSKLSHRLCYVTSQIVVLEVNCPLFGVTEISHRRGIDDHGWPIFCTKTNLSIHED